MIRTPGHTPGHVALYEPDSKSLFTGDTLFRESIGRTDLPGGDYSWIMRSIDVYKRQVQRRLGLGHARRRRSSESGPFGIGVGHVVLPGFEDRPCALNPSGRQAGIGENHVARFGLKPGQRGGNAGAVNRGTRHIGKRCLLYTSRCV